MAAYAPPSDRRREAERKGFYEDMSKVLREVPSNCRLVIGGDMNVEVWAIMDEEDERVLGQHIVGRRTEAGKDLVEF